MPQSNYEVALLLTAKDEASRAIQTVTGHVEGFESQVASSAKAAQTLLPAAGVAFAGLSAALGTSVAAASDFETTMDAVRAVMDDAEVKQFGGALDDLALKLGKDTVFSAKEAGKGIEELIKGGVSATDIMSGAADATLALASAGGTDLATAAEIASNALAQFNLKGADMAHVADEIAGAANASSLDVNDFKYSLAASGAVAATVGFSFDDLATAIAVMGQAGIKGSDAGTSLKTMMLSLQPATNKTKEEFTKLGLTGVNQTKVLEALRDQGIEPVSESLTGQLTQLQMAVTGWNGLGEMTKKQLQTWDETEAELGLVENKFFDATGSVKSMAEVAEVLQTAMEGMTDAQRLASLEVIFGSDAIRAGAVLSKAGAEGFEAMAASMGKVTAEAVAAKRLDNFNGSMQALTGSVETLQITIGTKLIPMFRGLVDAANAVIGGFLALDPAWQEAIAVALVVATAVAGVTTVFLGLVAVLPAVIAGVSAAATIFGVIAAVLSGPVVLAVGAVVLAVGALYLAWNTNFLGIRDVTADVWTFLSTEVFPPLQAALTWFTETLLPEFLLTWTAISTKVTEVWTWLWVTLLKPGLAELSKDWTEKWEAAKVLFGAVWDAIQLAIGIAWPIVQGVILGGLKLVRGDWEGAWEAVKTGFETAWEAIKKAVGTLVQGVLDALRQLATDAGKTAREIGAGIVAGIKSGLGDLGKMLEDALLGPLKAAANAAADFIRNFKFPSFNIPSASAAKPAGGGTMAAELPPISPGILGLPLRGTVSQGYGQTEFSRAHPDFYAGAGHDGIDIVAPVGSPVQSAGQGRVTRAGFDRTGYGNLVEVVQNGISTFYAHLDQVRVAVGELIDAGRIVGTVGMTGNTTGPHLHFGAKDHGRSIDPRSVVAFARGGWITEPIHGVGAFTGKGYTLGEREAEYVTPRSKMGGAGDVHYHLTFTGAVFGRDVEDVVVAAITNAQRRGRLA